MRQRCGKGDATIAGGAQDAMWILVGMLRFENNQKDTAASHQGS